MAYGVRQLWPSHDQMTSLWDKSRVISDEKYALTQRAAGASGTPDWDSNWVRLAPNKTIWELLSFAQMIDREYPKNKQKHEECSINPFSYSDWHQIERIIKY